MEQILIVGTVLSGLYAFAVVAFLAYDYADGRFKRLKSLRPSLDETQTEAQ